MSSTLRYDYGLQWREAAKVFVVSAGISFILACWGAHAGGLFSIIPIFLSVLFALFALLGLVRCFLFPAVLELTDDAILFPRGFSGKRIARVAFADFLRVKNTGIYPGMHMLTTKGNFEILSIRFRNMEDYRAARTFICSKTAISLPESIPAARTREAWEASWVPGPVLKWSEPKDYIRYRTHLAASKPLWLRLARASRFFAYCFGCFFIPWLILNFIAGFNEPAIGFFGILIPACWLFTWLHWFNATHPARTKHVTVFPDGFSMLSGKQTANFRFGDFSGWSLIEREFEGRALHILLLQRPKYVLEIVFPDTNIRGQFIQMLTDKKIPRVSDLKLSWELKS